jgi:hypothetical protein
MAVGCALLSNAWGDGYATEANIRSRRVIEKLDLKFKDMHKWDGPEAFIGVVMQPPEMCVYSLGPSAGIYSELQSSGNHPRDSHIP